MSDMTFPVHTLACDWPGCEETAHDDMYSAYESYESAWFMFAEEINGGEWLHTYHPSRDYCSKHWHYDDLHRRVPGPGEEEAS